MKKIIITIIIAVAIIAIAGVAHAAAETAKRIKVSGTVVEVSTLPQNSIKKFVDGAFTCYTFQANNSNAISCVK